MALGMAQSMFMLALSLIRKQGDQVLDKMPLHFTAEVLPGQAQAAMRMGRQEEATTQLVCQSCHEPNRLENRLKAVAAK